jgi:hypothetical protein
VVGGGVYVDSTSPGAVTLDGGTITSNTPDNCYPPEIVPTCD